MDWVQENEWANDQEKISAMEERIAELEAQLQRVLDREAATHARHDARVERLEARIAAADRLADGCSAAIGTLNSTGLLYEMNAAKALRRHVSNYRTTKGVM